MHNPGRLVWASAWALVESLGFGPDGNLCVVKVVTTDSSLLGGRLGVLKYK